MVKVYLAGPDVFYPEAGSLAVEKRRLCKAVGLVGLHPFDNEVKRNNITASEAAESIYYANIALMRSADVCIANLTPFRGPNVDDGTAFEVGFCIALGMPVWGYEVSEASYHTKVFESGVALRKGEVVEEFGLSTNLMIAVGIPSSGGKIVRRPDTTRDHGLDAFAACVKLVSDQISNKTTAAE